MKLVEAVAAAVAIVMLVNALFLPAMEILRLKKATAEERYALYVRREERREVSESIIGKQGGGFDEKSFFRD